MPTTTLLYLAPNLCLLAGALLILLLDVAAGREWMARWVWRIALGTGLLALASAALLPNTPVSILAVLAYDGFTAYVWRLLLGALVLLILLSESYVRSEVREPGLFYALLMVFASGALLLTASSHTIMLLLSVELLSVVGYVLVGRLVGSERSSETTVSGLVYGVALFAVIAFGFSWLYGLSGTGDFVLTSEALSSLWAVTPAMQSAALLPLLVFILAGFSIKIGVIPFYPWLPDTSAPSRESSPVAASLAILPRVAGFAALVRLTMVMLPPTLDLGVVWRRPLLGLLAAAAMLLGSLLGWGGTRIKRLVAYSGIAQAGYVLIALVVASEASLSALLVYLTASVLADLGAFAAITVASQTPGLDSVSDYRGLYKRAPLLAGVLMVCLLSLFGMPGTAGFIAKLWLFVETFRAGYFGLVILAALSSVMSLTTYGTVIRAMLMHSEEVLPRVRVPAAATVVLIIAIAGIVLIGIVPGPLLRWAQAAVQIYFAPG
jgi:proton-translocating NADH-quinone oxidoreductase chain N